MAIGIVIAMENTPHGALGEGVHHDQGQHREQDHHR